MGTLPFKRCAGLKGNDATWEHELNSIKKDLFINKRADEVLKMSREIKSTIDENFYPESLTLAIDHSLRDFKRSILTTHGKIKLGIKKEWKKNHSTETVGSTKKKKKSPNSSVADVMRTTRSAKKYVHSRKICLVFEGTKESGPEKFTRGSTSSVVNVLGPDEGIVDGDILLGLHSSHDTEAGNVSAVEMGEARHMPDHQEEYVKVSISKKESKFTGAQCFVKNTVYQNTGSGRTQIEDVLHLELAKISGVTVVSGGFEVEVSRYQQFITIFNNECRPHLFIG